MKVTQKKRFHDKMPVILHCLLHCDYERVRDQENLLRRTLVLSGYCRFLSVRRECDCHQKL